VAVERAAALLSDAGAKVCEIELSSEFDTLADTQATIMAYEAARNLAFEHIAHNEQLSPVMRELLDRGAGLDHAQYVKARAEAARSRLCCDDIFKSCDLILAPAAVGEAPMGIGVTGDPVFSRMWSLLYLPSICLPGFVGPQGLPVGVQLLGAFDQDERLLRHALWVEAMFTEVLPH
jgi:Asp-tRNA(Asn)/Glu-tRNA(Gln) amidotransferase A subunit family amidase